MLKKIPAIVWYILGTLLMLAGIIALANRSKIVSDGSDPAAGARWIKGSSNATVTLVEFADFQCPACGAYAPLIKDIASKYGSKVQIIFRHFPLLQIHPNALVAAYAAEAAGAQGKFWEMYDILFEKQSEWSQSVADEFFITYAKNLGLDIPRFLKDMDSMEVDNFVKADLALANRLALSGTPTFFLNGKVIENPGSPAAFNTLIDAALAGAPAPVLDPKDLANRPEVHEHVDFAVYTNGKKIDFSKAEYQSDPMDKDVAKDGAREEHDPFTHLHDGKSNIIHKHREGVTIGYFFKTIGFDLTKDCFTTPTKESFCTNDTSSLKFFVNGKRSTLYDAYELHDLDRVLITYGPTLDNTVQTQLTSVSDEACIYSEKCPERGKPPTESCVGGLGTHCE